MTSPMRLLRESTTAKPAQGVLLRVAPFFVRVGVDEFGPLDACESPTAYSIGDRVLLVSVSNRYVIAGRLL